MAGLSDSDRELIRDEIGTADPPTDSDLDDAFDELGTWRRVAIRYLKRRLADLESGTRALTIPGVIGLGRGTPPDPAMILTKIQRLTVEDAGTSSGRLRRADTGRGWPLTHYPYRW